MKKFLIINKFLSFFLIVFFIGCSNSDPSDEAIIEGTIKNFADVRLYLFVCNNFLTARLPIDSAFSKNGKFKFRIKVDSLFYPFEVCISYYDQFDSIFINHEKPIFFKNPYDENAGKSSFYIDRGKTILKGEKKEFTVLTVEGNRQNEIFLRDSILFGSLQYPKTASRKDKLNLYKSIINESPYSFYLLHQLWIYRHNYKEEELKQLLLCFNKQVSTTIAFRDFYTFFNNKSSDSLLSDLNLKTSNGDVRSIFDSTAKINMLVFWSRSCIPCRQEIPDLKEIYAIYQPKGLSISSISLNDDTTMWKDVLTKEQMPWKQYILNDSLSKIIDLQYNISAIPISLLFNEKGKLIYRIEDRVPKSYYEQIFSKLLLK